MKKSELKEQIKQSLLQEVGYSGGRAPQNSVKQIVDYLKANPFSSESQLQQGAFGYDRGSTWESNKKYADMLRRGMVKGIIARTEATVKGNKSKYFYFVPASTGGEKDFVYKSTNESSGLEGKGYIAVYRVMGQDFTMGPLNTGDKSEVADILNQHIMGGYRITDIVPVEDFEGVEKYGGLNLKETKKVKINKKF